MNRKLFKSLIAASAVAMICACGDEAASNNATNPNSVVDPGTGLVDNPGSTPVVTDPSNPGNTQNPGTVTDPTSNVSDTSVTNPTNPGNTTNPGDPQNPASSSGVNPQNPDDPITTPITSSNSVNTEPELGPDGFPTLESYGAPSPEYTKDISATAKRGWNTRYWDACKPH